MLMLASGVPEAESADVIEAGAEAGTAADSATDLTSHAAGRMTERGISRAEVDEAMSSAKESGDVTTRLGKYGNPQRVYKGTNGVTVVVETAGRNAGKVVTVWK